MLSTSLLAIYSFTLSKTPYKYVFFSTLLLFLHFGLQAKQWKAYTNVNNVSDVVFTDNKIYTATWGGVAVYKGNQNDNAFDNAQLERVITRADGLLSNDIRTLALEESTGDLWIGTYSDGISILTSNGISNNPSSNKTQKILIHNRNIYVATDSGIIQYFYLPTVLLPIQKPETFLDNINVKDITIAPNGYLYCATPSGVSYAHTDSLAINSAWHSWSPSNSPILNYPVLSLSVNNDYIALNTMMSVHRHSINPDITDWMTWKRVAGELQDSVFTVGLSSSNGILVSYGIWDEETMSLRHKSPNVYAYIDSNGVILTQAPELANVELPTSSIYRFHEDNSEITFVTWGQGLFTYSSGQTHHLESNCIGFQTISEIVTDYDNNMWITSGWIGGDMTTKGTRGVSKYSDGVWENYTTKNSPLTSDNILSVAVDQNNRKWFGSWDPGYTTYGWRSGVNVLNETDDSWLWYTRDGIRTWYPESGWAAAAPETPQIYNNTIMDIFVDLHGNIMVVSSGAGITIFDKDYKYIRSVQLPGALSLEQQVRTIYHSGTRYFFCSNNDGGLGIWNNSSLPETDGDYWVEPPFDPLNINSYVYGVVTITNTFGEEENWVACSDGLYMWDGTNWYRYDTDIKRRRYTGVGNPPWANDTLYYADEERLFGAIREARPTCIFLDPFNQIWIGSVEDGLTMYDPVSERFTNYYQDKSPLISNRISCFGYDPIAGDLLIGTPDGLSSLHIGIQIKTETKLHNVKAYPNPFFPDKPAANGKLPTVYIVNQSSQSMPKGTNVCKIYDSSGAQVIELKESIFAQFEWNGLNKKNQKCSSGIYFFVVTDTKGETKRGKIALIRGE